MLVNNELTIALAMESILYALRKAMLKYIMEPIARTHCKISDDGEKMR